MVEEHFFGQNGSESVSKVTIDVVHIRNLIENSQYSVSFLTLSVLKWQKILTENCTDS